MPAPKTTAQLRTEARAAESALDYATAANLYEAAAEAYPRPRDGRPLGELAKADIAALHERAADCALAAVARGQVAKGGAFAEADAPTVLFEDTDAFAAFAADHKDALLRVYPDLKAAEAAACQGGIVLDGTHYAFAAF